MQCFSRLMRLARCRRVGLPPPPHLHNSLIISDIKTPARLHTLRPLPPRRSLLFRKGLENAVYMLLRPQRDAYHLYVLPRRCLGLWANLTFSPLLWIIMIELVQHTLKIPWFRHDDVGLKPGKGEKSQKKVLKKLKCNICYGDLKLRL